MKKRNWNFRDDDTIFEMMRYWNNLDSIFQPLNDEMTRCFDMTVASSQWLSDWKKAYEHKGRPVAAYNLIRKVVNVINAVELSNRKKIVAKPTGTGDAKLTEIVTPVLHHFFHRGKFDWHRTKVFNNSIIAKYGVYHVGWSYENDPEGELEIDDIDPRTIRFEPNYADPSWQKAGYILRKHSLSFDELINKFALNDPELRMALKQEGKIFFDYEPQKRDKWLSKRLKHLFTAVYEVATGGPAGSSQLNSKYLNWFDPLTGKFDVLELHEKRTEERLMIGDSRRNKEFDVTEETKTPDGYEFDNELIAQVKERYSLDGDPRSTLIGKKFVTAVVPAFRLKVNEQPYPYNIKGYCYIPQYCYDYHADPFKAQSVVDDLIDPQSSYNKIVSLKQELIWKYANNGWIMDENAIDGVEEDWESGRMTPYRRVRAGYINHIKPELQQHVSPDLIRETQELPLLIEHISNAGSAMEGRGSTADKSAKHFIAKEQQQTKSFSYLFSNVDSSAIAVAEAAWGIIQYFVTVPRIFRITEDNQEPYDLKVNQKQFEATPNIFDSQTGELIEAGRTISKIKNDISIGQYDFEISKTPYSGNAKEIEFQKLAELFEAAMAVNQERANALLPIMVEEGDYPYAQKILKAWEKAEGGSPEQQQMQQMMMQLQQIMAKLGIEEKKQDVIGKTLENEKLKIELKQMAMQNVLGMKNGNRNGKQQRQFQLN